MCGIFGISYKINPKQDYDKIIFDLRQLVTLSEKRGSDTFGISVKLLEETLNEGWDVLNLFDIVRLYSTRDSATKIGKTTLSEAQLIGRGARYYPFEIENYNNKYQRKFDKLE